MRAVGYVRVSTAKQAEEGVSLAMQETKIRQWAELNDAQLLTIHTDDGLSGSTTNRPGLRAALVDCKRNKAALVVYSLSRLSRSTRDTLDVAAALEASDSDLVVLRERVDTTTPSGRMVFRMLAAINEFERDQVAERTRHAMQHLRAHGRRVGSVPHGYRLGDENALVADEREQEVLRLVKELRANGWTLKAISAELAARGVFNREGRPFNPKSVRAMALAA
jgi:site-specific DNA recombinase